MNIIIYIIEACIAISSLGLGVVSVMICLASGKWERRYEDIAKSFTNKTDS